MGREYMPQPPLNQGKRPVHRAQAFTIGLVKGNKMIPANHHAGRADSRHIVTGLHQQMPAVGMGWQILLPALRQSFHAHRKAPVGDASPSAEQPRGHSAHVVSLGIHHKFLNQPCGNIRH